MNATAKKLCQLGIAAFITVLAILAFYKSESCNRVDAENLFYAIEHGDAQTVKRILKSNININRPCQIDNSSSFPLELACRRYADTLYVDSPSEREKALEVIQALLENGANPNPRFADPFTHLIQLVDFDMPALKLLIAHGTSVDVRVGADDDFTVYYIDAMMEYIYDENDLSPKDKWKLFKLVVGASRYVAYDYRLTSRMFYRLIRNIDDCEYSIRMLEFLIKRKKVFREVGLSRESEPVFWRLASSHLSTRQKQAMKLFISNAWDANNLHDGRTILDVFIEEKADKETMDFMRGLGALTAKEWKVERRKIFDREYPNILRKELRERSQFLGSPIKKD